VTETSGQLKRDARYVELHRWPVAEFLLLRNKNSLFKKFLPVAHVDDGNVAAGQQDHRRLFRGRRPFLRRRHADGVHAMPLGITFDSIRILLGGSKPLDNSRLKVASRSTAPRAAIGRALLVLADVLGNGLRGGE
jgi:hypothetical protein